MKLEGIHHVTAITADAPGNVDFYTRVLGLRLVKKTVNQDDPTVYHLFYADEKGSAGSDLTFFEYPGLPRGRAGAGMVHAVAALADPGGFEYTFGGPFPGGPAAFWRQEAESGQDPLEALATILQLPYTLASGTYVWPFAYDKTADTITDHERELLEPLEFTFAGEGYLGWRAGIAPDGRWTFFVAGD